MIQMSYIYIKKKKTEKFSDMLAKLIAFNYDVN